MRGDSLMEDFIDGFFEGKSKTGNYYRFLFPNMVVSCIFFP
jgi:hypothetical protein